jgi:hypothetical protein
MAAEAGYFRFAAFADAPAAQKAFEAAYPLGSPIESALQMLVGIGAHCRRVNPNKFACRYVENEAALAGFCWHVALGSDSEKAIQEIRIALAALGV